MPAFFHVVLVLLTGQEEWGEALIIILVDHLLENAQGRLERRLFLQTRHFGGGGILHAIHSVINAIFFHIILGSLKCISNRVMLDSL